MLNFIIILAVNKNRWKQSAPVSNAGSLCKSRVEGKYLFKNCTRRVNIENVVELEPNT